MSAATELIRELRTAGAEIRAEGAKLVVEPASVLTEAHRARIRALKPGLLFELSEPRCRCGEVVSYYRPDGTPLCTRHSPRWLGGCDLADLAGELAPKIHFTIRATTDPDGDLDHLRELFHILDQHPGGNLVSIRIVELDGLATWFERQALASKQLRLQLATTIRDRDLALRKDAA